MTDPWTAPFPAATVEQVTHDISDSQILVWLQYADAPHLPGRPHWRDLAMIRNALALSRLAAHLERENGLSVQDAINAAARQLGLRSRT